jgi:hypothetical protein
VRFQLFVPVLDDDETVVLREAAQLVMDERQELVKRLRLAPAPGQEQRGGVMRLVGNRPILCHATVDERRIL